jgi:hypothetical protein
MEVVMEAKLNHIQGENARMRYLLKQIAREYGKRSKYTGNLFTSQYQPHLIQQSMRYAGITGKPEKEL